ncbi:MAG: hypothetical protein LBQ12_11525 [Deltaproteobacteria bacterium]|nr:hypothetical protein [Deltaproteobacteria bacterium]
MTQPLHPFNQAYLHLPAVNGFTAAQAQAGEEQTRLFRLEQARELHRDTVERVAETMGAVRVNPVHPDPGGRNRARYEPAFKKRARKASEDPFLAPVEQVVDRRV